MAQRVDIQIRLWPWSTTREEIVTTNDNISFPYFGSPVIVVAENIKFLLPKRNEQFVPHGTPFTSLQGQYRLYEMPHGVLATREKNFLSAVRQNMMVYSGNQALNLKFNPEMAMSPLYGGEPSDLAKTVMAWSQFFDDCIDGYKRKISDNQLTRQASENQLPWQEIYKYLNSLTEDINEPRMALIVHIAQQMHTKLSPTVRMARKILLRERTLLPVERIAETDTACLRWYIRQPGDTMAQKAASHRQSLMGISRKESFDTLENKVLKDFLMRCKLTAQRYMTIVVGKQFSQSSRGKSVRQFQNICTELAMNANLQNVSQLRSRVKPNYVLQSDIRYREIWQNYQRLLRQEDEEDRSWDWQSRTWADITRMLIGAALLSMKEKNLNDGTPFASPLMQASMFVLKEQRLGCRIVAGSEPGPFVITPDKNMKSGHWILEIVHPEDANAHVATTDLARTGGHLYLVLERIGRQERRVIIIWAVHTASSTHNVDCNVVSCSAQVSLNFHEAMLGEYQTNFPKLSGMIIASDLAGENVDFYCPTGGTLVLKIPADPRKWASKLEDMAFLLQECIEKAIQ
ncbi:MAG: DUF2357 domain-containing protein [Deltaproteobacteria bacterium]|jgi:hypothetical protein|nr:DUF2357 domain-containing protein [Deltaproteobacteria bacterium]